MALGGRACDSVAEAEKPSCDAAEHWLLPEENPIDVEGLLHLDAEVGREPDMWYYTF
jgi:hypothetical protein